MVLYSRSDKTRKPEFQIITTIEKSGSELIVRKSPSSKAAYDHIKKVESNYKSLDKRGAPFLLSKPKADGASLVFKYHDGTTLDAKFTNLVFEGKVNEACEILDFVIKKITDISYKAQSNKEKDPSFVAVFGDTFTDDTSWVSPGNIDYNLDNILEENGKLWLIDYEWVFDFPVPLSLILTRIITDAFWRTNDYFLLTASPSNPVINVSGRVFVPKEFFKKYEKYFQKIPQLELSENNFQFFVRGLGRPTEKINKYSTTEFRQQSFPGIYQHLQNAVEDNTRLKSELQELTKEHEYAVSELRKVEARLKQIYNSRTYRILRKFSHIYKRAASFFSMNRGD